MFILLSLVILIPVVSVDNSVFSEPLTLYPAESRPNGLSYQEHAKNWWKWLISIPADKSPIDDTTGERCSTSQSNSSSLFYLTGSGGGEIKRTCKIPEGMSIVFAPSAVEMSDKEGKNVKIDDMHRVTKADQDSVTQLRLTLDGKPYSFDDLKKYRIHTDPFEVVFPDKGIFGVGEGGKSTIVADGYYLITQNLTKGIHEINYFSEIKCPMGDCATNFSEDLTYTIIVE